MGVSKSKPAAPDMSGLTERQQKWFASVQASLERDTGKSLEQWVKIAQKCPETTPRKRVDWLREKHGLGVNRAAQIFSAAFPDAGMKWDEPEVMLAALWKEPEGRAIYDAVIAMVKKVSNLATFSSWRPRPNLP